MQFSITIISMLSAVAVALPGPTVEATSIMRRTCGTLTGDALSACQTACKALCNIGTAGIAKTACTKACDLGPLKVRETEVEARDIEIDARDTEAIARSIGQSICNGACDVACNSTVLALEQTKCLAACKAKCA
ncbi:hypothetical protein NQ176_g7631 [Zarea fungicola]|uniref:Uncharacterized protein n=1 Tax=Zarea fungicola TaxID=93591 RepID=A0ACC1MYF4_9HYPO|nr:hypothetical protein NQ176_g7631 [Lecanicillium fungicola]